MRMSGNKTNPFQLEQPNASSNPFMPTSCDKHLSFFMPLRLWDFTICQGDAFHPSPWQASEEEEDEQKICYRGGDRKRWGRREGNG